MSEVSHEFEEAAKLTAKAVRVFCDCVPESKLRIPEGIGYPGPPTPLDSRVALVNFLIGSKSSSLIYFQYLIYYVIT